MIDIKQEIANNRKAIKPDWVTLRSIKTDRELKLERPETFKRLDSKLPRIELLKEFPNVTQKSLTDCIGARRSLRKYKDQKLTLEEISYILWETARATQFKPGVVFRSIPTGGATNGMETYIYLDKVDGIKKGLYHYEQDLHSLVLIDDKSDIEGRVNNALMHQLRGAAIVLFLTAVPYRSEYKYSFTAHKMLAMEAGHAFQNTSLASEVIDCAGVCIAAYNQDLMDQLLQVDGVEEFSTYAMPIGKKL